MQTHDITFGLRIAAAFAVVFMCAPGALADTSGADPAADLRARYVALSQQLESSAIQRGLHVESNESATTPRGDAYAVIQFPFATVAAAFAKPANWCDTMILHLNVQYCRANTSDGQPQLSAAVADSAPPRPTFGKRCCAW